MSDRGAAWLGYAHEDLAAATDLLGTHDTIALFHAHQAAEKGLKALEIHRRNDITRTHDLVRLSHELNVPTEFHTVLEDLNPADTATRYPDAPDIDIERPAETLADIKELLQWITEQSNE